MTLNDTDIYDKVGLDTPDDINEKEGMCRKIQGILNNRKWTKEN